MPMWDITKNPPLACHYLAAAAAVVGWSEAALHAAFLLPAVAVSLTLIRRRRLGRWALMMLIPVAILAGYQWGTHALYGAFTAAQVVLWAVSGASLLGLAAAAMWRWRDAPSLLLGSWTNGTFLFAGFVNWTVKTRKKVTWWSTRSTMITSGRAIHRSIGGRSCQSTGPVG
jgi:hypothetical protein